MATAPLSILLTGATGFLGSHFLLAWLDRNPHARVFALVRADDPGEAQARATTALARSAATHDRDFDVEAMAGRITALPGDLARDGLGLSEGDEARLAAAGILEAWHFAAAAGTGNETRENLAEVNLLGTERLFALTRRIGARRFVHISTACAAGRRTGPVPEAPPDAQGPFDNASDAIRAGAELRLLELARDGGPALSIVRPTVVLGPSDSKTSSDTPHGLYGLIRRLATARDTLRRSGETVRLPAGKGGTIDIIPVDGLMQGLLSLAGDGFPGGPIHHFAGGAGIDARIVAEMIVDRMRIPGLDLSDDTSEDGSEFGRRLSRELDFFRSHIGVGQEFLSARPRPPAVNEVDLLNYVEAGVRDALYGTCFDLFERRIVRSFDGSELAVYTAGSPDHPALVCCNAYGVPPEVFAPLAHDLLDRRHIVVWGTRGLPSLTEGVEDKDLSMDNHLRDIISIMDALGIGQADLTGWSTGAVLASKAAARHPERFRSLALLNGGFVLPGAAEVPFQTATRSMMPKMAASRKTCEILYNLIFGNNKQDTASFRWEEREFQESAGDFVGAIYKGYLHMARLLMRDVDSCFRYARIVRSHLAEVENAVEWLPKVTQPTLVLTCVGDITSHPEGSYEAARLIPDSILHVHDRGDHFLFYSEEDARQVVCDFLDGRPVAPRLPAS